MSNDNRQPAGTPVGGQFAPSANAAPDASVALTPAGAAEPTTAELGERYRAVGDAITAASAHKVATTVLAAYPGAKYLDLEHSDQGDFWQGESVIDADGNELVAFGDDLGFDEQDLYTVLSNVGSDERHDFVEVLDRGGRARMDLQAAANEQPGDVKALVAEYWDLGGQITDTAAREIAAKVLEDHPDARYVDLEHSDQGDWYQGGEIFSSDGDFVADFEDYELETVLSNIPSGQSHPFIVTNPNGREPRLDLDQARNAGR